MATLETAPPPGNRQGSTSIGIPRRFVLAWLLLILACGCGDRVSRASEPREAWGEHGETALHRAAAQGRTDTLGRLLSQGAQANARDAFGRTPLVVAVESEQAGTVNLLLESGADVELQSSQGVSPLYAAAYRGNTVILDLLLAKGAELEARGALGRTALFTAAGEGRPDAVRFLLDRGADANRRCDSGQAAQTPLHCAAIQGAVAAARHLLDHGADPNARDDRWGFTPLYLARVLHRPALEALLLSRGADPSVADMYGMTPAEAALAMQEREARKLTPVALSPNGPDPRALVYLVYVARTRAGYRLKDLRLAFAVGDGGHLLTSAHCLADFGDSSGEAYAEPLVISRYHGDLAPVTIVAIDTGSDVAILRAPWKKHPALSLSPRPLAQEPSHLAIAGFPPRGEDGALSTAVYAELLRTIRVQTDGGKRGLALAAARFVGPGWSGSPILLPGSGAVRGVFGQHDLVELDGKVILHHVYGCDSGAVRTLARRAGVDFGVRADELGATGAPGADEAFALLLRYFESSMRADRRGESAAARRLVELRPGSPYIHLLAAKTASGAMLNDKRRDRARTQADRHYRDFVRLAPDSALAPFAYGCFLQFVGRHEEAAVQLREAKRRAPDSLLIGLRLLRAEVQQDPGTAVGLGAALCEQHPKDPFCRFEYAGTLRALAKYDEAVEAARNAIELGGPFYFRGRLASVLALAGRLDEAETVHRRMVEGEPETATYWLWYAKFLIDWRPESDDEASRALDMAERHKKPTSFPPGSIKKLREKLPRVE